MPTRTRSVVAILRALTLTVASCSSSTESSPETTPSPSSTPAAAAHRGGLKTFRWP